MKSENKTYLFLGIILAFLVIIFFVQINVKKTPEKKSIETVLLNPKYKNQVSKIVMKESEKSFIELVKNDSVWTAGKNGFVYPVDEKYAENILNSFADIVILDEITDSPDDYGLLGLNEEDAFSVSFFDENNQLLSKIYFGSDYRFIRSDRKLTCYEFNDDTGKFSFELLTCDENYWCDINFVPLCLKLFPDERNSLTRGLTCSSFDENRFLFEMRKSFLNSSEIIYRIYENPASDKSFIIRPVLIAPLNFSEKEKKCIGKINYAFTVSRWTLDNLKKM